MIDRTFKTFKPISFILTTAVCENIAGLDTVTSLFIRYQQPFLPAFYTSCNLTTFAHVFDGEHTNEEENQRYHRILWTIWVIWPQTGAD